MSRRSIAIAAALSVLALGSPLIAARANPLFVQYFNKGVERMNSGNYQGAITYYTKAIEIDPQYASAYSNRGIAKAYLKDYQGSIADFNTALEINPKYSLAYRNRGITREMVNDLKGACDDWRKAADLGDKPSAEWVKKQC
jgi:tetratricopeptide (TPR) repeat protein